jgi:serine protease Do
METIIKLFEVRKNKKVIVISVLLLVLISGVVLGQIIFGGILGKNNSGFNTASMQPITTGSNDERQTPITRAVAKVSPAIVGINVEEVREVRNPFFDDPFFRQFFGDNAPQKQVIRALGSGFIISEDGYILTNDHVVGNATKISVTLTTGETVSAKIIGSDAVSDVALIKIDRSGLPFVPFGNSDEIIIGEWAIGLGNPFGLFDVNSKPTVTVGVISATNMKVSAEGNRVYKDMVQTDASINAGNSGGPLVNASGEVIGINTIIYTGGGYSQGSIGVGFAISINRVKKILEQLKSSGKIDRSFEPGFRIQGIDDQIAKYYNLPDKNGVIVTQVLRGGNADKAGLKAEDIIIAVNGDKVKSEQDLVFAVNDSKKGDKLILTILRNGSKKDIELVLD